MRSYRRARLFARCSTAGLIAAAGCFRLVPFTPLEPGPQPRPGTVSVTYPLRPHGEDRGEVRVWAPGIHTLAKSKRPVIELVLRVNNGFEEPVALDVERTELELADKSHQIYVARSPVVTTGPPTVEAGQLGRVVLLFDVPSQLEPGSIVGFELNWALRTPVGLFARATPFLRSRRGPREVFNWYYPAFAYQQFWWPGPYWPMPGPGPFPGEF